MVTRATAQPTNDDLLPDTRPVGRVQRRREQQRTQMLDVAEALFAAQSYATVRIEDVAERADVAVGTLYSHFGNKDGLLAAVAERALDRSNEYVDRACAGRTEPVERLWAISRAYLDLLLDFPSLTRFLASPATLPDDDGIKEAIRTRVALLYDHLAAEIAAGVAAGVLRVDDPVRMSTFLIGAWVGVLAVGDNPATPGLPTAQARETIGLAAAVLMRGMLASPPAG